MAKSEKNTNTNTNTTATKGMSQADFNKLFPETSLVGTHTGIYKPELFANCTENEKIYRRRKLRNQRDKFLGEFLAIQHDASKLAQLKKDWAEYATKVYINIKGIYEENTNEDVKAMCKTFVKAME